MLPSQKT